MCGLVIFLQLHNVPSKDERRKASIYKEREREGGKGERERERRRQREEGRERGHLELDTKIMSGYKSREKQCIMHIYCTEREQNCTETETWEVLYLRRVLCTRAEHIFVCFTVYKAEECVGAMDTNTVSWMPFGQLPLPI